MHKVLRAIQRLLIAESITGVKKVIYGDPYKLPEGDMPCITVSPIGTEYTSRGNQYDQKVHNVAIKLVYNAKAIFGKTYANPSEPTIHAIEEAVGITELTNANLETQAGCIMGVLRKNLSLPDGGNKTCETITINNVSYQKSNERAFPTYEVQISIDVIQVANR